MSDNDLIRRGDVINVICEMHVGGKDAIEHALPNTYAEDLREIIYEVDDIPAVPQEMTAREYEEAFHRISCEDVETYRVWWEAIHDEDWGRAVAIVEEWAKEHPKKKRKTYAEDFREHFNREWNDGTSKDIPFFLCRNQLYKGQYCDMHSSKAVNYKACAECWNAEMEEEK